MTANFAFGQESLDQRHQKSTRILENIRKDIKATAIQEVHLADEIAALNTDRAALNENLIQITAKSRNLEQRIERASNRVLELEESRGKLRESLSAKNSLMSEVLAALQRLGKNPPPALLVTPQDALISVRSAILLGSVVPEIRNQTQILSGQLSEILQLSEEIGSQREQLSQDLETEFVNEQRISLLIEEKKKYSKLAREKLGTEGIKSAQLAARATNLTNLIGKIEEEIKAVNEATQAAKKADAERQKNQIEQIANVRREISRPDFSDSSRINPAVEFSRAKGHLIKPVNGVEIRKFGDKDELGDPAASIAIATRINARVVSPADGWVVYSGPFRSYGQMLILNAGTNHYIILSGMGKIDVELGQFVLVGEPVGIMGSRRIASAGKIDIGLTEIGMTRPVLAIEFRKNGEPIDPAKWWQANIEKRANDDS